MIKLCFFYHVDGLHLDKHEGKMSSVRLCMNTSLHALLYRIDNPQIRDVNMFVCDSMDNNIIKDCTVHYFWPVQ